MKAVGCFAKSIEANVLRVYFVAKHPADNKRFGNRIKPACSTSVVQGAAVKETNN